MIEPIYMYRPVMPMHIAALQEFALSIGLVTNLVSDMHVTLAYSRSPVDWDSAAFQPDPRKMTISGGARDTRTVEKFDGGAIVLNVPTPEFNSRWAQLVMAGASWDWPDYRPHVTLGYDESFDIDTVANQSYTPDIQFGGEVREWLDTEFSENLT